MTREGSSFDASVRCEILERELRAAQASERASRARETALACELEARRRRRRRGRRDEEEEEEEAEAEARSGDGLCLTPMTARRGNSAGTSTSREDSAWRERCEAAESRAARATTALTEVAAKGAEERERAIANAVDAAVSDAERRWRAEMEELSRSARADARALHSSRNRAGELAAELREAQSMREEWQKRAEAAMEASESMSSAVDRMRRAVDEAKLESTESQQSHRKLATLHEQLKASQIAVEMRDAERKKLVSELQMVRDRAHEMNLRLSEAQAEAEHARETVSVEAAEKDRLNGEVAYLRGELERLRATHETETSDFTDWRSQTERQEKELSRELHEARRDAARHALTVRKLEQQIARGPIGVDARTYERKIAQLENECATNRETVREISSERDALRRRIEEMTSARAREIASPKKPSSTPSPSSSSRAGASDRAHRTRRVEKLTELIRRSILTDEDVDENDAGRSTALDDDDDDDDDAVAETDHLFRETVDDFFEDDDAEDERLEAEHRRAYALARRLQSIESRAAALLS